MWLQLPSDWLNVSFYIRRNVNILGLKALIRPCLCFSSLTLLVARQKDYLTCKKSVLVRRWWWFDWSFTRHIAPAVTTTSIILAPTKIPNGDILVPVYPDYPGKRLLSECCCCLFRIHERVPFQLRKWDSQHFPDQVCSLCRNWQTRFKCLIAPSVSTSSSRLLLTYTNSFSSPCTCDW